MNFFKYPQISILLLLPWEFLKEHLSVTVSGFSKGFKACHSISKVYTKVLNLEVLFKTQILRLVSDLSFGFGWNVCAIFSDVSIYFHLFLSTLYLFVVDNNRILHALFISHAFFSTQPQCYLTCPCIELRVLLRRCLIHIGIIILRHILYLA